jgi:hypothetical protein
MDMRLDVQALARDAGARVKIAYAMYEQDPTASSEERLSQAVRDWERALEAWSKAIEIDAALNGEEPFVGGLPRA